MIRNIKKRIIDHLVSYVYVEDDDTILYLNIRGGKGIETEKVSLSETKKARRNLKARRTSGVQTQLPTARHGPERSCFGPFLLKKAGKSENRPEQRVKTGISNKK